MPTPIGGIFTLDRANWSLEDRREISLPRGFEGHMVLVVGWAAEWDWVRIVAITSSAESTEEYVDYLPISPTPENPHARMNPLKFCYDPDPWIDWNKNSYVKINSVGEVRLNLLKPVYADSNGLRLQLRKESTTKVQNRVARLERHAAAEREAAEKAVPNQIARMEHDLADFSIVVNPAHGRFERDAIEAVCITGDGYIHLSPEDNGGVIEV